MQVPTLENSPLSKIHLIGGEKGGVGKSMMSRLLAQYFIDHQLPFVGFDTDRSHGSLMRFYADYASPALVDSYEALDRIIEAAVEQPGSRVLVDLAAQTHEPLVKWMDESGVLDMADLSGITLNYWHVMDSGRDSVDLLARLLDRFGQRLHYVLVRNQLRGDDFGQLERSGQLERALGLGARVVDMQAPARRRGAEDRRPQRQLLAGQERVGDRRPGPGPDGAPAPEDVAEPRLRRDRQGGRLTVGASGRHRAGRQMAYLLPLRCSRFHDAHPRTCQPSHPPDLAPRPGHLRRAAHPLGRRRPPGTRPDRRHHHATAASATWSAPTAAATASTARWPWPRAT